MTHSPDDPHTPQDVPKIPKNSQNPQKAITSPRQVGDDALKYSTEFQCVCVPPRYACVSDMSMRPKSRTLALQCVSNRDLGAIGDHNSNVMKEIEEENPRKEEEPTLLENQFYAASNEVIADTKEQNTPKEAIEGYHNNDGKNFNQLYSEKNSEKFRSTCKAVGKNNPHYDDNDASVRAKYSKVKSGKNQRNSTHFNKNESHHQERRASCCSENTKENIKNSKRAGTQNEADDEPVRRTCDPLIANNESVKRVTMAREKSPEERNFQGSQLCGRSTERHQMKSTLNDKGDLKRETSSYRRKSPRRLIPHNKDDEPVRGSCDPRIATNESVTRVTMAYREKSPEESHVQGSQQCGTSNKRHSKEANSKKLETNKIQEFIYPLDNKKATKNIDNSVKHFERGEEPQIITEGPKSEYQNSPTSFKEIYRLNYVDNDDDEEELDDQDLTSHYSSAADSNEEEEGLQPTTKMADTRISSLKTSPCEEIRQTPEFSLKLSDLHDIPYNNFQATPNNFEVLRELRNFISTHQIDTSEGEELTELAIYLFRKLSENRSPEIKPIESRTNPKTEPHYPQESESRLQEESNEYTNLSSDLKPPYDDTDEIYGLLYFDDKNMEGHSEQPGGVDKGTPKEKQESEENKQISTVPNDIKSDDSDIHRNDHRGDQYSTVIPQQKLAECSASSWNDSQQLKGILKPFQEKFSNGSGKYTN
ncbi:uncharacterized protein LOC133331015 [Musca vetustissima]|uniref:uncharacterized protein LOC133331015 n=1 Tax=Musca vetustissima TaxID=27455 RepID=UPI002AB61486|nr:uncharacterized protein LOC133331015 [Musca vetustissima]